MKPRIATEQLAADFEAGLSTARIAAKHGMRPTAVRWRLNRWRPGCVAKRRRRADYERMLEAYRESAESNQKRLERNREILVDAKRGMSFNAIGAKHGVNPNTARRAAIRLGLPKARVCTQQRDAEWLAMHEGGLGVKEVARVVGRPWSTVREGIVRARDGYVFRERMVEH